jgi:histidine triad (HIT) family protein
MNECIFCKILNGELDSSFVFHGKNCSAFLDIHPMNPGHVLIVPHQHRSRLSELTISENHEMFEIAQKLLIAIERSDLSCEAANIFLSDGEIAGQDVFHSHLHVVPRFKGDGHRMGITHSNPKKLDRSTLNGIAEMITSAI